MVTTKEEGDDLISAKMTDTAGNSMTQNKQQQQQQQQSLQVFSNELREFYENHDIDLTKLCYPKNGVSSQHYRYIRLNPRYDEIETLNILKKEVRDYNNVEKQEKDDEEEEEDEEDVNNDDDDDKKKKKESIIDVMAVPWLEDRWGFYALPEYFSLSTSLCYRSGRIYGMDVSSGAGVAVLLTDHHDKASINADTSGNDNICGNDTDHNKDSGGELRILDLCCSPGLKLLQMVDFFYPIQTTSQQQQQQKSVKVVGVDISKHRMNVCKSIVQKYLIDSETSGPGLMHSADKNKESSSQESVVNVQLYLENGTTFGRSGCDSDTLIFDSGVAIEEMIERRRGKRKRMNKSARGRERKRLRQIESLERCGSKMSKDNNNGDEDNEEEVISNNIRLFDYVLVDAECSTDGSFKHIKERIKESLTKKNKNDLQQHREDNLMLTDSNKLAELVDLQRKLIDSGFHNLKVGGTMVYSTCSLSEDQNEKIVQWLLQTRKDAKLIPIHFPTIQNTKFVTDGSLKGTIRFYPNLVQDADILLGDGFFVAKIMKRIK
jgi:16S rRNA C967 or C1407 C5-methylase (RsmB/RsmF family)